MVPVRGTIRDECPLWSRFVPPNGTKGLFSAAQRAGSGGLWSRLVAPTGTKGGHWFWLVPRTGTKGVHWSRFMARTGTNVPRLPKPRCGGMFSPTSLAEERQDLFISPAPPSPLNSSELQASGPNLALLCLWACWAFCGPESWPMDGFLVVFRPWWPSRWHFFLFFPVYFFSFLLYLFYFVSTYNKILIYFILFYFVCNYLLILFYDNSSCY